MNARSQALGRVVARLCHSLRLVRRYGYTWPSAWRIAGELPWLF